MDGLKKSSAHTPSSAVKQVFKELEFLGWYTTGGPPDPSDIHVHKQVHAAHTGAEEKGGMVPESTDAYVHHWCPHRCVRSLRAPSSLS